MVTPRGKIRRKTLEPDGITAKVHKVVFHSRPDLLLGAFTTYLKETSFLSRWKAMRLVLISKAQAGSDLVVKKFIRTKLAEMISAAGRGDR